MSESPDSLAHYYAERANEYDSLYEKPERQEDLQRLRSLVLEAFAGSDVLELACGTGYWTQFAAQKAKSVLATDINETVLDHARKKTYPANRVRFQCLDLYGLPTFPHRFNAGLVAFFWSHIPRTRLPIFLDLFHKTLAPGARVIMIDNRYVEGSSTPISRTDSDGNTYQHRALQNGSRHEVLKNFPEPSELESLIRPFSTELRIQQLPFYWVLDYRTAPAASDGLKPIA